MASDLPLYRCHSDTSGNGRRPMKRIQGWSLFSVMLGLVLVSGCARQQPANTAETALPQNDSTAVDDSAQQLPFAKTGSTADNHGLLSRLVPASELSIPA